MTQVTDFGDLAVLLPISGAMLLWLLAVRSPPAAAWWLAAFALCSGGTSLLKIYFFACSSGPDDIISPSGHSSLSTLIYGALAVIAAPQLTAGWRQIMAIAGAAALVATIAVSRLVLGVHSILEIVLGIAVGLASLALFTQGYLRHRPVHASLSWLLVPVILIMVMLHGRELRAEEFLHALSQYLPIRLIACR